MATPSIRMPPAKVAPTPVPPVLTGSVDVKQLLQMVAEGKDAGKIRDLDNALWQRENVGIQREGSKIILPADPRDMSEEAAIDYLQRKIASDNEQVMVHERILGYPFDAAVAFVKAIQNRYGWASPVPTPGFWGPQPPQMLPVRVGPEIDEVVQVPLGSFNVPGIESRIESIIMDEDTFIIRGKIKNADKAQLMQLITDTRQILAKESIYRGKALRLLVDDDGELQTAYQPEFLHTKHVQENELIFSNEIHQLLETTLFTPMRKTAQALKHGIPLKRGILLAGPYGTGKSMTAGVASKIAVDNGWTFILLNKVEGLRAGLEFAKRYEPAVLFAEDIDRIIEDRDDEANDLLNTIDGVLSKDAKVITVVTTNHIEKINKAMLRPGRLDADRKSVV